MFEDYDPFMTVYRSKGSRGGKYEHKCFHFDANCPLLHDADKKKGRLGAQLTAGRRLCALEAGTWSFHTASRFKPGKQGGRDRPLETLGVA